MLRLDRALAEEIGNAPNDFAGKQAAERRDRLVGETGNAEEHAAAQGGKGGVHDGVRSHPQELGEGGGIGTCDREDLCPGQSRTEDLEIDTAAVELEVQGLGEGIEEGLAPRIDGVVRARQQRGDRRDVDHCAAATSHHGGEDRVREAHDGYDVELNLRLLDVAVAPDERTEVGHSGVVDEQLESLVGSDRRLEAVQGARIGQVDGGHDDLAPVLTTQALRELVQTRPTPGDDSKVPAVACEPLGEGSTDSRRCPGDECPAPDLWSLRSRPAFHARHLCQPRLPFGPWNCA